MEKITTYAVLLALLVTSACAGHDPNPVMVSQYGDEAKSCQALQIEMSNAQAEMQQLIGHTDKTGQNVALGVVGWFLIVPLFFMDFKNGEKVEYDAWRQRYMHLSVLAEEKHCGVSAEHIPTSDEILQSAKREQEKRKAAQRNGNE